MNCGQLERVLESLVAGGLAPAETAAARRHLDGCERCRDLVELARIALRPDDPAAALPPADFVPGVLLQTAGPGCGAAERALCAYVDGALAAEPAELVEAHLSRCAECRALASVLAALGSELPRLAEIRPDPGFVDAVLAATLPLDARLERWWRERWPRWVARPRFAVEAAYVTTLIFVLIFSTPGSPLEAMPRRAVEMARRAVPAATLERPWARLEAAVALELEALRESGATRRVAAGWRGAREGGAAALEGAAESGARAYGWTAGKIRTIRQRLASMLEEAGEAPSPADRDSD